VPSNTLKRDGSWIVELLAPLKNNGKDVLEVVIKPPGLEHVIRWGQGDIPSTLALLAELCDLPEKMLRTITYPDVDRVMLAFTAMMPSMIQQDFQQGKRPLASDVDDLPAGAADDQTDPRFPHVEGPMKRFPAAVTKEPEGTGMSLDPPETTMKAAG
jgi:hypothetical protein